MNQKEKIASFVKKNAKILNVKIMKTFHYIYKLYSHLVSNPRGSFLAPEAVKSKIQNFFKKSKKLEKYKK